MGARAMLPMRKSARRHDRLCFTPRGQSKS